MKTDISNIQVYREEIRQQAGYMPKGCYTIREWGVDGEYLTFDPTTNKVFDFNN